jgi:hypothetical protein
MLKSFEELTEIVKLVERPPQSPDLSPTENLWDELDRHLDLARMRFDEKSTFFYLSTMFSTSDWLHASLLHISLTISLSIIAKIIDKSTLSRSFHHLSTVESNSNHRRTPETTIDDLWRIRAKYDKTVDLDLCVIDDKSVLFCCCPTHSTVNSPRVLKCRCERAPLVREELQRGTVRVYRRYGNITIDGSTWAFGRRSLRAENWVVILTKTTPTSLLVGVLARLTAGREQRDNKNVNCSTCNWEKTRELVR